MTARIALLVLLAATPHVVALAADQPISGTKLVLKRGAVAQKLVFTSDDPAFLFPAAGSPDDPTTQDGLSIVLFAHAYFEQAVLVVPPGVAIPGWKAPRPAGDWYRFRNRTAPDGPSSVRAVVLRRGKGIRIVARVSGLMLTEPTTSVGIRIQSGSLRSCALFDGATVARSAPGFFVGRRASAPVLPDCGDDGLRGLGCEESALCGGACPAGSRCGGVPGFGACRCIADTEPCGDTAPVCNGQCPAGQACANVGGLPGNDCACLPEGSTPCGTTAPTCGGDCPSGLACYGVSFVLPLLTLTGCDCLGEPPEPPPPPCGGPCPPGSICAPLPGQGFTCVPRLCSGGTGFPTCDGSCPAGETCRDPKVPGATFCICMP